MDWQKTRRRFRAQLSSDHCVHPGSVFDPISARIAEDLGFEVGMFAGSVASLTVLGDPDLIVLTLSEFAEQAYRICRAGTLPILVDADHGYGNALNVKRTVEELETAGVAGLSIEDTVLPRPFACGDKTTLISIAEGVGKMRAAVAGRQDPSLVIAARTSAVSVTGLDNALARIEAYQTTGVDAIFLIGVKQKQELESITKVCRLPLILGGAGPEIMDLHYLGSMGVRVCLQGHQPFMAAIQAVYNTLKALREGTRPTDLDGIPDKKLIEKFSRAKSYDRWIEEFLE
ncbi:MAG: isocitrate lyase/phosphoenolpyruvate mutase family protein [Gammaproteobacteria bacterium]|nr:isocitrate lyase/phosphoenolpyruvate mutase family protein [Gammaproteobacteria bacterium]MDH3464839.1 isocitrate lyase/phosphoenolpyruvate mutase family protein [Gammaproteobacteria bacterium]